ncbi:MAG TPA: RDD family protein [Burkholderiales bacterium]|nr:RDD family protein [Burkholderiales bacterium]
MFGIRRSVVEFPADGPVTMGGGELAYAGFWSRFAALIVDNAILMIAAMVLVILASLVDEGLAALATAIYVIASLLYWPILECSARQATFGKQLLGLQVTDAVGQRVSFLRSLGRNLAKIISAIPFYIGFLLAAFTSRKQALHDIIATCVVVRAGPSSFKKAVGATLGAILLTAVAGYYYVANIYLPEMERAMKAAQKGKPAVKPAVAQAPAPDPAFPAADQPAPPPVGAQPTAPAIDAPPTKVAAAPVAPAEVKEPAAPVKSAEAPAPAQPPASPAKPATVEIKPAPAQPAESPAKPASVEIKPAPAQPAAAPAKPVSAELKSAAAPAAKAKPAPGPEPVTTAAAPVEEAPKAEPRPAPAPRPAPPEIEWSRVPVASGPGPIYNDIMTGVMYRNRAAVVQLLDLGWWPDRRDSNGVTPLMAAAMNGDAAMTELLLSRGANAALRGPGGSTLDYANRGGDGSVADLLRKAGAR